MDHFLPLLHVWHRWSDRIRRIAVPAFPGYLFFRGDPDVRRVVSRTRGVVRVLGGAADSAVVPDAEVLALRRALASEHVLSPEPRLTPGSPVEVLRGPLEGLRGTVVRNGRQSRFVVEVPLLGQGISVDLDEVDVEPV